MEKSFASLSTTEDSLQRFAALKVNRKVLTVLLVCIDIMWPLGLHTPLAALPFMAKPLNTIPQWVQFSILIYLMTVVCAQSLGSYLANHYGRRPITILGLLIFTIAGFGCAFSNTIALLILCRIAQGLGGGLFFVIKDIIVADIFDDDDTFIRGLLNASTPTAMIIAVILGGVFITFWPWQSIFIFISILSSLTMIFAYFQLPETMIFPTVLSEFGSVTADETERQILMLSNDEQPANVNLNHTTANLKQQQQQQQQLQQQRQHASNINRRKMPHKNNNNKSNSSSDESEIGFDIDSGDDGSDARQHEDNGGGGGGGDDRDNLGSLAFWDLNTIFTDLIFVKFNVCKALFSVVFLLFICEWPFIAVDIYAMNAIDIGLFLGIIIMSQIVGSVIYVIWHLCFRVANDRRNRNLIHAALNNSNANIDNINVIQEEDEDAAEDDDNFVMDSAVQENHRNMLNSLAVNVIDIDNDENNNNAGLLSLEKQQERLDEHHARIVQISGIVLLIGSVFAIVSPWMGTDLQAIRSGTGTDTRALSSTFLSWTSTSYFYNGSFWYFSLILPMLFFQMSRGLSVISLTTIADEPYPQKTLSVKTLSKVFIMAMPALVVMLFTQLSESLISIALFTISIGVIGVVIAVCIFCVSTKSVVKRMKQSRAKKRMMLFEDESDGSSQQQEQQLFVEQNRINKDRNERKQGFFNVATEYDDIQANPDRRGYNTF